MSTYPPGTRVRIWRTPHDGQTGTVVEKPYWWHHEYCVLVGGLPQAFQAHELTPITDADSVAAQQDSARNEPHSDGIA